MCLLEEYKCLLLKESFQSIIYTLVGFTHCVHTNIINHLTKATFGTCVKASQSSILSHYKVLSSPSNNLSFTLFNLIVVCMITVVWIEVQFIVIYDFLEKKGKSNGALYKDFTRALQHLTTCCS